MLTIKEGSSLLLCRLPPCVMRNTMCLLPNVCQMQKYAPALQHAPASLCHVQRQVAAYLSSGGELDTRCRNRVVMNGPGGVGRSEVAVARVSDVPSRQGPTAKSHQHQQNLPLTEFFQKGVRTAMRFLGTPGGEVGLSNKLQCALLTVILPVDALARTIVLGSRAV
eukprot:1149995-Pelagomonas_calceolata.AAC.5